MKIIFLLLATFPFITYVSFAQDRWVQKSDFGGGVRAVAEESREQNFAYVVNTGSDNVTVINTTTGQQTATIPVSGLPYAVTISPDGKRAYVTNSSNRRISIINTRTNTVDAGVDVGSNPLDVAVSPNGSRVYVTNANFDNLSVINTADNTVIATISVGIFPYGVAVDPDGSMIYVANRGSNNVSVINANTNAVVATIDVGSEPQGLALSNDGQKLYISNVGSGSISVINTLSNIVEATIPVGASPAMIALSANGTRLYAAIGFSDIISVINTSNNIAEPDIYLPPGSNPYAIAVSRDGKRIYVSARGSDAMLEIDPATSAITGTVAAGTSPHGIALAIPLQQTDPIVLFAPVSVSTYAGNGQSGFADGSSLSAEFFHPTGVAIDTAGNLFVADAENNRIRKIMHSIVSTSAGNGIAGYADGPGANAKFSLPTGATIDHEGNIIVADSRNHRIRKIDQAGNVTTLAGDGIDGMVNGLVLQARFSEPSAVAVDGAGNIFVADQGNHMIRKISASGVVSTFAGNGQGSVGNGVGTQASFFYPNALTFDTEGNLFVTELYGPLRKISPYGLVTSIRTPGYSYDNFQGGIAIDGCSNIYLSINLNATHNAIYKINLYGSAGVIAGGLYGYVDGIGMHTKFAWPAGMCADSIGQIFVADSGNNRMRRIGPPQINLTTQAGVASSPDSFGIMASNLNSYASIMAPNGFEVSLTKTGGFSSSLEVSPVVGEVITKNIYVRLKASLGAGNYFGNLNYSADGAVSRYLSITGTVTDSVPPIIHCPPSQFFCSSSTNYYTVPPIVATDISGIQSISYTISGATVRNGIGADASGNFSAGYSQIEWIVVDSAGNNAICSTIVRTGQPLNVIIPNVHPLPLFGKVNTIYKGFGPACTVLKVSASGGTRLPGKKYTYLWSTGSTTALIHVCPNTIGNHLYTVTVTDSLGCTATDSITIKVIDVRCGPSNNEVLVCWFGSYQSCYKKGQALVAILLGANLGPCETSPLSNRGTDNPAMVETTEIRTFPNPNNGSFTVQLNNIEASEIRITDVNGKIIFRERLRGIKETVPVHINLGNVSNGIYMLQILSKKAVYSSKILVQH